MNTKIMLASFLLPLALGASAELSPTVWADIPDVASLRMDGSNPLVKTRFTADPAGYVDGEWLYVFMGHDDATARGYKMYDWSVVRTKDMKNWEDFGAVMSVRETFPWARPDKAWASQAVKRNGKWYWYVAISDKGGAGRQGGDCIGVHRTLHAQSRRHPAFYPTHAGRGEVTSSYFCGI